MVNQSECAQCTDYLNTIDFHEEIVCPVCFKYAKNKRDEAVKLLKEILPVVYKNERLRERINKVVAMREY